MKYGRSSEKLEHAQLELLGGHVTEPVTQMPVDTGAHDGLTSNVTSLDKARHKREAQTRPGLRELPAHPPRRTVVHTPLGGCGCTACGGGLREIGQDVSTELQACFKKVNVLTAGAFGQHRFNLARCRHSQHEVARTRVVTARSLSQTRLLRSCRHRRYQPA